MISVILAFICGAIAGAFALMITVIVVSDSLEKKNQQSKK